MRRSVLTTRRAARTKGNRLSSSARSMKIGVLGKSGASSNDAISLNTPRQQAAPSNPTISTIVDQLSSILKAVDSVGLLTKQQQDMLVDQIKQTRLADKEQEQEKKVGSTLLSNSVEADQLRSIEQPLMILAEQLADLNKAIRNGGSGNGLAGVGSGVPIGGRAGVSSILPASKAVKSLSVKDIAKLEKQGYKVTGSGILSPAKMGVDGKPVGRSFVSMTEAAQAINNGGFFGRMAGAAKSLTKPLTSPFAALGAKVGGTAAAKTSQKIAGSIAGGIKAATKKTSSKIGLGAIQRVAGPLIAKGMGKTVLKSIPIIGALAGGAFAVGRLMKGDVVGAGLELASGLGGPLTAIPAFVASVARDTYSGVYGVQPEDDLTSHVGERLSSVTDGVKSIVASTLTPLLTTEKDKSKTPQFVPTSSVSQTKPPVTSSTPMSAPNVPSLPAASKQAGGNRSSGGSGDIPTSANVSESKPALASTPVPAPPSAPAPPAATPETSSSSIPMTPAPQPPAVVSPPPGPTVGSQVMDQTMANQSAQNSVQVIPGDASSPVPRAPASSITTKNGAAGIGNVPSVDYPYLEFANQLFFESAA